MDTTTYQTFGKNMNIENRYADPVQQCLPGNFFNGAENPLRYDIGRCNMFMGERCARQWDGYCDVFLNQQEQADMTGKAANKFLLEALSSQFCQLDSSMKGVSETCYTKCEQMDPLAPDSAMVCETDGDYVYRNTDKMYNIDTQFNALGRLSTASPIRIGKCPKVCNLFSEEKLSNNNRVLNECLDRGIGMDILVNIAKNAISQNVKITNDRFNNFIQKFVITNSNNLQPGYSSLGASPVLTTQERAMPAVNPYIIPNQNYLVTDNTNFGPQMVEANKIKSMTEENALEPSVKEGFKYGSKPPRFVALEVDEVVEVPMKHESTNKSKLPIVREQYRYRREEPLAKTSNTEHKDDNKSKMKYIYIGLLALCLILLCYIMFYMK